MIARLPLTARIGLGLVLIGVCWFGSWALWAATRIWVPLQMPISLSQGHIQTAEFKINLEGTYELYIEFQPVFDDGSGAGVHCPSPLPRTAWSLSKGGQVVKNGNGGGHEGMGGFFYAGAGRYTLDFDVRDNGTCLNAGSPRLVIAAFRYQHPEVDDNLTGAFFLSLLFAVTGFNLFVHSYRARRYQEPACSLTEPGPQSPLTDGGSGSPEVAASRTRRAHTAFPTVGSEHDHLKLTRSYVWRFQRASWFGLIAVNIYLLVLLPFWVMQAWAWVTPVGLRLHLLFPAAPAQVSPGIQPLLVRVASGGSGAVPNLYVNSQLVSWQDFGTVLQKELSRRPPNWPVYLEGDGDMEWRYAVNAIDTIRGLHAEVILLPATTAPVRGRSERHRR